MTAMDDLSKNDGRISAAVRVNGELRLTARVRDGDRRRHGRALRPCIATRPELPSRRWWPGYDLGVTVYPATSLGRVSIAVFVNSSCGRRAEDRKAALLAQLFDDCS
jgi:hypothetical protein